MTSPARRAGVSERPRPRSKTSAVPARVVGHRVLSNLVRPMPASSGNQAGVDDDVAAGLDLDGAAAPSGSAESADRLASRT